MVKEGMSILRYLGISPAEPHGSTPETDTVRKITEALDRLDPDRARYIAGFAYILSRVGRADLKISDRETRAMERIVVEQGGLPEEQAIIVVQIAKTQTKLFGGTENFLVTREFSKMASLDQKLSLLDCLFAVGASEGMINTDEDNEIRQIAEELGLDHRDFIAVRSKHRDQLSFLNRSSQ